MLNVCEFTAEETATVLAALRFWQAHLTGEITLLGKKSDEIVAGIEEIADWEGSRLSAHDIDKLCEEING